jgi:hypothetical protein
MLKLKKHKLTLLLVVMNQELLMVSQVWLKDQVSKKLEKHSKKKQEESQLNKSLMN